MKCDKTILALLLQFIYFGKSGDVIPSALTTEFDKWMKYYEIETVPIVWEHFKEIEILPSTSNGFKLNSRNFEPMNPTPVRVEVTAMQRSISTANKSPAIIEVKKPATVATSNSVENQKRPTVLSTARSSTIDLTATPTISSAPKRKILVISPPATRSIAKRTKTILKSPVSINRLSTSNGLPKPHILVGCPTQFIINKTTTTTKMAKDYDRILNEFRNRAPRKLAKNGLIGNNNAPTVAETTNNSATNCSSSESTESEREF